MTNKIVPFPGVYVGDREEHTVMVPMARLAVRAMSGPLRGQQFLFDGGPFVIGRSNQCTVTIPSHAVSRVHARIEYTDGGYWLMPERTVNGSRINDTLVQEPTLLSDADRLQIGDSTFAIAFVSPGQENDPFDMPIEQPGPAPADYGNVRYSTPTMAAMSAAPPRASQPEHGGWPAPAQPPQGYPGGYDYNQAPYPAGQPQPYPPPAHGYPAYVPPQQQPMAMAPPPSVPAPKQMRWGMVAIAVLLAAGVIVGIVLATVKLVSPEAQVTPQPIAAVPPPATPAIVEPPAAPVVAVPAAPIEPAPTPTAAATHTGVLSIETTKITASVAGTLVDVVAVGTAIKAGGVVAHQRRQSAQAKRAHAKLQTLIRKYGKSPEHEDFIAEARQNYAAANKRRPVEPIVVVGGGTVTKLLARAGEDVKAKRAVAVVSLGRLTVPVAAVEGTGSACRAQIGDVKLDGTLLPVGSTERTIELAALPATLKAGDVADVRISCPSK